MRLVRRLPLRERVDVVDKEFLFSPGERYRGINKSFAGQLIIVKGKHYDGTLQVILKEHQDVCINVQYEQLKVIIDRELGDFL